MNRVPSSTPSGALTTDQHFIELRRRINQRLRELQTPDAEEQIKTDWLYGALGAVPASTLFACENPSLNGVRNAAVATVDGGPPDIEAQWWGGRNNNAACRFRRLLVEFGLKAGTVESKNDWQCYITNVSKEANVVGHQRQLSTSEQRQQARDWADVLAWEIERVQPRTVILVGQQAQQKFSVLQRERLVPAIEWHPMSHYSQRRLSRSEDEVLDRMRTELTAALGGTA